MEELKLIQEQIAELQKRAEILQAEKKAQAIKEIKEAMATYGLSLKDVGLAPKKPRKKKEPVEKKES